MKYLIVYLLLIQYSTANTSQLCDEYQASPLLGNNCIPEDTMMGELPELMGRTPEELKKFCSQCKSPLTDLVTLSDEGKQEKNILYTKTVMNELQKELTYITTDLLKIRSSFKFNIDSKKISKACNLTNLKPKTNCMTADALKSYKAFALNIQNSLATEVSNILSDEPTEHGLFNREKISCSPNKVSEKEILFAKMRYEENLLTPSFIKRLKEVNITKSMTQNDLKKILPSDILNIINDLKGHPFLRSNFEDGKAIESFLRTVTPSDTTESIVEKLYSSNDSKEYSKRLEDGCNKLFKETTSALDKLFCNTDKPILADDLNSVENILDSRVTYLDPDKAESSIKAICSHANDSNNILSLSSLTDNIRGTHSSWPSSKEPLSKFKTVVYEGAIGSSKANICRELNAVSKDKQCSNSYSSYCEMLKYIELSRAAPEYKNTVLATNDGVNDILRSLIGDGLPQKDGKPDATAILFLKSEGILPGGDSTPRPPQQDAVSFHRAVANSNNNSSIKPPTSQAAKAPAPAALAQQAPTSQATTSLNDDSQNDSQFDSQFEAVRNKTDSAKNKNSFSALSNEEQMNLLNRMKSKSNSKKPVRSANAGSTNDSSASYSSPGQNFNNGSFATDQAAAVADNTAVDKPAISQPEGHSGSRAKLDPKKIDKDASFNEAKIQASQNRAPASDITKDTVISLSKTDGGLNKIEIKVPDESVLGKKTPELETKIQDYLDKSGQSLQGAKKGEAFMVKLGKYDIKVSINDYGVYVATCKDKSIHPDYLAFLSRYFTGIKERVSSTESMKKVLIESTLGK